MADDMATEQTTAEQLKEKVSAELQAKCDAANKDLSGVGTRKFYGFTRGKGSAPFLYDKFDTAQPKTLPTSIQAFMDSTGKTDEPSLVNYLIAGYNEELYTLASDPIAEFVNPAWSEDMQSQFRLAVRNYSRATNTSIEDTVALMKPGVEKAHLASQGENK